MQRQRLKRLESFRRWDGLPEALRSGSLEWSGTASGRRLQLVYVPFLRFVGFGLVAAVALPLHNLVLQPVRPLFAWLPAAVAIGLYPVAAWLWLMTLAGRPGRFDLGRLFLNLDLVVFGVAIYFTGAESSWIFFLPLLRVADQAQSGSRDTLFFAHAAPLVYLVVLSWRLAVDGAALSWGVEATKLVFLYAAGLYLALTAMAVEGQRREMAEEMRLAKNAIRDLQWESRRLLLSREELKDQVIRDPLTGLLNRRGILGIVDRGLERSMSDETPFSVVMADLDRFKAVNDRRGHAVGDAVLRWVATRLLASGRAFDAVGRIGGDEFLVALPNCDIDGALNLAERIRRAVNDQTAAGFEEPVDFGVSLGVATARAGSTTTREDLVEAADRALYQAKASGGDRVEAKRPLEANDSTPSG